MAIGNKEQFLNGKSYTLPCCSSYEMNTPSKSLKNEKRIKCKVPLKYDCDIWIIIICFNNMAVQGLLYREKIPPPALNSYRCLYFTETGKWYFREP